METNPKTEDAILLHKIAQHRDQTAMEKLYDRYARVIYTLAYRSLRSAEEAEEIVLDVFAQVWRIASTYDAKKSRVDAWLFMLTRSRALDKLRVLARSARVVAASEEIAFLPHTHYNPEEDLLVRERQEQVQNAIVQLPPEQRQAIELAYYQGLTHTQIAATTGNSLGTIKTRIRLGLNKLRQALVNSA